MTVIARLEIDEDTIDGTYYVTIDPTNDTDPGGHSEGHPTVGAALDWSVKWCRDRGLRPTWVAHVDAHRDEAD